MRTVSKASIVTLALVLSACTHYSDDMASLDKTIGAAPAAAVSSAAYPQDIAPAAGGPVGGSLNTFLARDYYDLARYENDKAFDYKAAGQYTKKAMNAQKGQLTVPSKIAAFDVPSSDLGDLTQARKDLIIALKTQNTPENARTLAKAQSSFDCWIERSEEADNASHYADCKSQFEQSMALLIAPAAGADSAATVYQLGFLQTSAVPDDAANKRLEYIAQTLLAPQNAVQSVALSAPEGETGAARVNAVRAALVAKGVAPSRITLTVPDAVPTTVPATEAVTEGVKAVIIGSTTATSTTTTYVPVTPTVVTPGQTVVLPKMPAPAKVN